MNILPFTPDSAGTVSRTVSGTTATVVLFKTGTANTTSRNVMVTSPAANAIAFIEFGDSTVTAVAATGTPILPGAIMMFTVGPNVTNVSAIGSAGTLYFTTGLGA